MRFRLGNREDWTRVKDYVSTLAWVRDGKQVWYRVEVEEIKPGKTPEQNGAQFAWYTEAEKQLQDNSAEWYRAYCKLHFGVPILRNASAEYRAAYDRIIRPLPYEHKLQMMMVPLDWPVTRAMDRHQISQFLDEVYQFLTGRGVNLERTAA
jgi:hypothetical protein